MNATPRPWKHSAYLETNKDYPDRLCGHYAEGRRGEGYVAYMMPNSRGTEEANADLIVRAVNSFDAMREALGMALSTIERLTTKHGPFSSTQGTQDIIKAALALAKGEGINQ